MRRFYRKNPFEYKFERIFHLQVLLLRFLFLWSRFSLCFDIENPCIKTSKVPLQFGVPSSRLFRCPTVTLEFRGLHQAEATSGRSVLGNFFIITRQQMKCTPPVSTHEMG